MGVPKFAAWLNKKYPAMVLDQCPDNVHGLYIDLNGLIHPCCHDEHDASVARRTELEKLRSICLAIETLVVTVRPQHIVYVAIDGVAPRAKMNQQRARRYSSAAAPLTNTAKSMYGDHPGGHGAMTDVGTVAAAAGGEIAAMEREFTAGQRAEAEQELADVSAALEGNALYGGPSRSPDAAAEGDSAKVETINVTHVAPVLLNSTATARQDRFDSNCISPGTAFMDAVAAAVRDFITCKLTAATSAEEEQKAAEQRSDPLSTPTTTMKAATTAASPWADLTVVFSDSNTAGEGEHKFMDFLRTQSAFPGFNSGGYHVIAGLDADLIFLSLSLHIPRVVILRDHDRSSYERALLPVSAGGTLVPKAERTAETAKGRAAVPSDTSFSADSSPVPPASSAADGASSSSSAVTSPTTATEAVTDTNAEEVEEKGDVLSTPASPPASPAPPPPIANVITDACTSYEYYDIDVVGASIVSEVYALCQEKNITIHAEAAENVANALASNGYEFRLSPRTSTTAATASSVEEGAAQAEPKRGRAKSAASSQPPAAATTTASSFHPCTASSNCKIIDDFIVLGMLLGNDFLPHSPSVYCGESAMDTLLDVYASAVLPYGYLTGGRHDVQLVQLERFLRAYAKVEALRFRQYAIQSGAMTPREAATPQLCTSADRRCWRDVYVRSTSLKDETGVQAACRGYVEGLRFVWRYYTSIGQQVSWSWYYPFHQAPLAMDVADFLRAQGPRCQELLAAPRLERTPPQPFCQLLCILPPTSQALVPAVLHAPMLHPPPALEDTFPLQWKVDYTGAYGKDHLAAVMLPFANLPALQEVVAAAEDSYTAEERARNALCATHLVVSRNPDTVTRITGFQLQGGGLRDVEAVALPAELQGKDSLCCQSLEDVVPPLSRPRTYSHTVPIPNLTILPDGTRVPAQRRPANRYGGRRGRHSSAGGKYGKNGADNEGGSADSGANTSAANKAANGALQKPPMLFGELLLAMLVAGVCMAAITLFSATSLKVSLVLLLQLCGLATAVLGSAFVLGLAVSSQGRTAGSGLRRHNIFTAYADWQCPLCLSLNFSRNRRCFICRAPFDAHCCVALFSGRNAPEPPLMDPDHAAYAATFGITALEPPVSLPNPLV